MAWQDKRDTLHSWDVYFSRSTNYGQTFEPNYPINDTVTTGSTPQDYPSIYYKDSVIYAAWHDGRDSYAVYFAKSTNGGLSFGPNVCVSDDADAHGYYASISADDSAKVYIVWSDFRDFSTYGYEIYFAFSSDSGQNFSENVLVNDHFGSVGAWDQRPAICVNREGKVFVAWDSDRNDPSHTNPDIYFARGTYVGIEEYSDTDPSPISLYCYPNPFSNRITIKFQITNDKLQMNVKDQMTIKIYNSIGRLVKQFNKLLNNQLTWQAEDQQDQQVPAGIYFIELNNGEERYVSKVIKIE